MLILNCERNILQLHCARKLKNTENSESRQFFDDQELDHSLYTGAVIAGGCPDQLLQYQWALH